MNWDKKELACELGTDEATLDKFLEALEYPGLDLYSEADKDRLVNLWETTGAAEQMAVEGVLRPSYQEHMQSKFYDEIRRETIKRAEFRCQICNAGGTPIECHHRAYGRIATPAESKDTIGICTSCHQLVTAAKRSKLDLIRLLQARR